MTSNGQLKTDDDHAAAIIGAALDKHLGSYTKKVSDALAHAQTALAGIGADYARLNQDLESIAARLDTLDADAQCHQVKYDRLLSEVQSLAQQTAETHSGLPTISYGGTDWLNLGALLHPTDGVYGNLIRHPVTHVLVHHTGPTIRSIDPHAPAVVDLLQRIKT